MCLITKSRKVRTATQDIVVYKVLIEGMLSPSQYYQYKLNEKQPEVELVENKSGNFALPDCTVEVYYGGRSTIRYMIGRGSLHVYSIGYHAFTTVERLWESYSDGVYKSIIPKGSQYILDQTGLIVASNIIIIEEITG